MKLQRAEALGAAHYQRTTISRASAAATPTATSPRWDAPDRAAAERLLAGMAQKYQKAAPKWATWLEENVPEGLTGRADRKG